MIYNLVVVIPLLVTLDGIITGCRVFSNLESAQKAASELEAQWVSEGLSTEDFTIRIEENMQVEE